MIITVQRKRCGYRYERSVNGFLEDPATPAAVLGGGFAVCQLAWLGDAFSVSEAGECVMLVDKTPLERFAERGVEWMVCRRCAGPGWAVGRRLPCVHTHMAHPMQAAQPAGWHARARPGIAATQGGGDA